MGVITNERDIYRGDTPTFTFNIYKDGTAYDLTGATVTFGVKEESSSTTYKVNRACTLDDASGGECSIKLTVAETTIEARAYVAELQVTTSGGDLLTVTQFQLNILNAVVTA